MMRPSASPWLIAVVGIGLVSAVDERAVDLLGLKNAAVAIALFGVVLGWLWYAFSPRPLAERLFPWAVVGCLGLVVALLGGSGEMDVPGAYSLIGIVGGLVIAERLPVTWQRQRDMALSTRKSMSDLR
jgi:hypothetical protein